MTTYPTDAAAPSTNPGRAAVGIPAGGDLPSPGLPPPAGPRTWTIEMPAAMKLLSPNARYHWSERSRRSADLKQAAWAMAISRKVPGIMRASVVVEYQPPDRRHRDADNVPAASAKPCIDGIVAAGVLADDDSPRYVTEIAYRIGPVHPGGRLVLHITEVTS